MLLFSDVYFVIIFIIFYIIFFVLLFLVAKSIYESIKFFDDNNFVRGTLEKSIKIHNQSCESLSNLSVILDRVDYQDIIIKKKDNIMKSQESTIGNQKSIIEDQKNIIETQNKEILQIREKFLERKNLSEKENTNPLNFSLSEKNNDNNDGDSLLRQANTMKQKDLNKK